MDAITASVMCPHISHLLSEAERREAEDVLFDMEARAKGYVPERTCRMEPGKYGYPICSNCGEEMNAYTCEWSEPMEYSYPFCYACGAKVVDK